MKILLVKPATIYPAIGLASLAAFLEKESHEIKILDLGIYGNNLEEKKKLLLETISAFNPKLVGMTSLSTYWNVASEFGELIKAKHPEIITVYGGPHVSQVPAEAIRNRFIDYIVVGEGEVVFSKL